MSVAVARWRLRAPSLERKNLRHYPATGDTWIAMPNLRR